MTMKRFKVLGKGTEGYTKDGEGRCITYPIQTAYITAASKREAEIDFLTLHPDCDEVLSRETTEVTTEELKEEK